MMSDMETLHKYYDAIRTGDPDRQVSDGVDIKAVKYAIGHIEELEAQLLAAKHDEDGWYNADGFAEKCRELSAENERLRRSVSWARSLIPPSSSEAREWRSQALEILQGEK